MRIDLQFMTESATIVEDPDTSQMSARLLPRDDMSHLEEREGVEEMSHLKEREGVEKIYMNKDLLGEARIQKRRTSPPGDTQ